MVVASIRAHSRGMYQHAHHPLRVVSLLHRGVAHWPSGHERMFIHARDAHRRLDLLSVVSIGERTRAVFILSCRHGTVRPLRYCC